MAIYFYFGVIVIPITVIFYSERSNFKWRDGYFLLLFYDFSAQNNIDDIKITILDRFNVVRFFAKLKMLNCFIREIISSTIWFAQSTRKWSRTFICGTFTVSVTFLGNADKSIYYAPYIQSMSFMSSFPLMMPLLIRLPDILLIHIYYLLVSNLDYIVYSL